MIMGHPYEAKIEDLLRARKTASKESRRTWVIEDHLCRGCGGRILRCVTGNGMTGGGNPIFKCADCGKQAAAMGADALCWCGFSHRNNHPTTAYICQPFTILALGVNYSEDQVIKLRNAFLACGCNPERGEVGIMLDRDYRRTTSEPLP